VPSFKKGKFIDGITEIPGKNMAIGVRGPPLPRSEGEDEAIEIVGKGEN